MQYQVFLGINQLKNMQYQMLSRNKSTEKHVARNII